MHMWKVALDIRKINIKVEEKKQTNLLEYIVNFSNKPRPR